MALVSEQYLKDCAFGYIRQNLSVLFPVNQSILSVDAFQTIKFIVLEYAFEEWSPSQVVELIGEAEKAERYEDMCKFVRKLVEIKSAKGEDLENKERDFLSVAYKNAVDSKRTSWRTLTGGFDNADKELTKKYKTIIEVEIEEICNDVLSLLTDHLLKNVESNGEAEVFYLKMGGDYYRYLSEFKSEPEDKVKEIKSKGLEFYKKAMDVAEANLRPFLAPSLGLALNLSVFYYEILGEPEKARDLAKKYYDVALESLDYRVGEVPWHYETSPYIRLFGDNLKRWKGDNK